MHHFLRHEAGFVHWLQLLRMEEETAHSLSLLGAFSTQGWREILFHWLKSLTVAVACCDEWRYGICPDIRLDRGFLLPMRLS